MPTYRTKAILIAIVLTFYVCPLLTSAMTQGADLQEMINSTPAGGTLSLSPTDRYTGNFTLNKAITIDGNGAKIVTPNPDPAINIPPNTDNVTLQNLDISASGLVHDIVKIGAGGTAQDTLDEVPTNITLNNVLIHGDPLSDSQRGVAANGANVTIQNSRIYEIHLRGSDSQAICAWNGPGPFTITDNYLEAAGENIMFGGADPSIPNMIPSDIQIRRNHFFKPLRWKKGDPSFVPLPPLAGSTRDAWSVKNLLELKMGRNVIIDSNVLENSWGDSQIGYGVLFTVRNQNGGAPWAIIENVTYSNNVMKNTEQGMQLLGLDWPNISQQATGLKIWNNSFENIKHWGFVVENYNNVSMEHNTHIQGHNIILFAGKPSVNFSYRNNATIRNPNGFGIFGNGVGEGTPALNAFAPGWILEGNVIAAADARFYPVNNFYPPDLSTLQTLKGTDGLKPGYMGTTTVPTPTPSPSPVASPSPSATVSPSPSPSPSATPITAPTPAPSPTPTCTLTVPDSLSLHRWGSKVITVSLVAQTASTATVTATPSSGQVTIREQSRTVTGTSALIDFQVSVKNNSSSVKFDSPCGVKTMQVTVTR